MREGPPIEIQESSDEGRADYQDAAYWSLPENVRHAIDLSKKKSKHTDFYN
jgi:hypothetical protein